ncbi:TonB-dependent receptor plug domain-containing protein [Tsuneonella sp. HG222]
MPHTACALAALCWPVGASAQAGPVTSDDPTGQVTATGEALAQTNAGETYPADPRGQEELGAAAAADAAIGARQIYTPEDFAGFNPRSALDMLQQVPGFAIEGPGALNANARGLGQASGNVLLNGERIVTKAGSVTDELTRISASSVVRIEVVDGATLGIPGISGRVANVVARSTDGMKGQFEWRPQLAAEYADMRWLEGIVSLTGTFGNFNFTLALEGRPVRNGNAGINRVTFGNGTYDDRFSLFKAAGDDKRVSGAARYRTAGGTVMNLNASYLHRRFRSFEDETVVGPPGTAALTDFFRQRNRGHDFEVSGDVDFALGPGRLKLIGLTSAQTLNLRTQSILDPANGSNPTGIKFEQGSKRGERIGRSEYSWAMLGGDWQWSVEAAFNKLDQVGMLAVLAPSGDFVPIPFPSGTGGVREDRYESLLSFSRQLADGLTMQLVAGGEYSAIRQTGNDANARSFQRPKGTLTLGWTPGPGWSVSAKVDRRVGQLNFSDFLAAVNLGENNQNASNNELRPDQSWGGEIEVTRNLGAWGSITARGFARRFEDFITIVPTATGGEARGNVDWARIFGGEVNGTLKFDPIGLPGGKVDVRMSMRDSRYPDPVDAGYLPVQFAQPHSFEFDFRYDIPRSNWAVGTGFRDQGFNPYYRVAEYGYDYAIDKQLTFLLEHKNVFGLTVQAKVNNLLERPVVLNRFVYVGPRGSSPLLFSEDRRREIGRVVNFIVKGNF